MIARPLAALLLFAATAPTLAQDSNLDKRVGRLESELKAVQRKVFPGGNGKYFEPEIAPAVVAAPEPVGVPATSPIADLTTRVDGLERQLATLTGQVEQANFRARQVEEALAKFRADAEFRLTQLEGGGTPPAVAEGTPPAATPAATKPATTGAKPTATAAKAPPPAVKLPTPKGADLEPGTETPIATAPVDPIEAEFQAAYSLYQNKRYNEAEVALAAFVTKRPKSRRASHAQYWLGRAYFSDKQPGPAAKAFLDNYRNMPRGERAVDSLLWLGQSLMAITPPNPTEACRVYDEVTNSYATKLTPALTSQLAKGRTAAKCAP